METFLGVCVGIGLSAACGFRVFVPLLAMSLASMSGHLTLAHGFEWIGTYPALVAFSCATALEIAAYYVPWLDNLLDTIATPAAIVAGTLTTAAMVGDMSPFLKWTLAAIVGGGTAGVIQGATVLTRGVSTAATGGLGNHLVATGELGLSTLTAVLALVVPLLVIVLVAGFVGFAGTNVYRKCTRKNCSPPILPSS
jgi:hypothetical protein